MELTVTTKNEIFFGDKKLGRLEKINEKFWRAKGPGTGWGEPYRTRKIALKDFAERYGIDYDGIKIPTVGEMRHAEAVEHNNYLLEEATWLLDGGVSPWDVVKRLNAKASRIEDLFRARGDDSRARKFLPVIEDGL